MKCPKCGCELCVHEWLSFYPLYAICYQCCEYYQINLICNSSTDGEHKYLIEGDKK